MDISCIRPLPQELKSAREELRTVGYELVHYTYIQAASVAVPVRHSIDDYLFGIHKIFGIYPPRVVIETHTRRYCNRKDVEPAVAFFLEQERPASAAATAASLMEPSNLLLAMAAPPLVLTMLGLGALENRQLAAQQVGRRKILAGLSEMPEFQKPHRFAGRA